MQKTVSYIQIIQNYTKMDHVLFLIIPMHLTADRKRFAGCKIAAI